MKINDIINGFKIVRARESRELSGVLWEMVHEKTGAELCWVDNGCANKLFSIAFKTVPSDDTGVFHILEHSVLCGSKRYPVKEPFLDLLKSSMNTFLNAMTFPDKTMYPVSSRNDRDFLNLTGVYLDAVFAPAIYENENIFRQEGWHYELHDGDTAPTYKGVVFNEMKGAFSSVDTQLYNAICRALFPDNCYGFVSGGDPEAIPDLTYEQFLSQHAEYYHPSNSKIFLDGAVPLDAVLSMIDGYLCAFERSDKRHDIPVQRPVASTLTVKDYEIGADEDPADKTQFAFAKLVGRPQEDHGGLDALVLPHRVERVAAQARHTRPVARPGRDLHGGGRDTAALLRYAVLQYRTRPRRRDQTGRARGLRRARRQGA